MITQERRPAGNWTANSTTNKNTSILPVQYTETWLETFTRRVIVDALNEATATYWAHRAEVLEDAAPRPDEFHGKATREELSASWQRCHHDADLCRRHAALLRDREVSAARDDWGDLLTLEAGECDE